MRARVIEGFDEHVKTRDEAWYEVWNERLPEKADWNGYESTFTDRSAYEEWTLDMAALITESLALTSEDDVVDLGCGSGRLAQLVAPKVRIVRAYDYSRPALDLAVKYRSADNIVYSHIDLNEPQAGLFGEGTKAYAVGVMFYLKSVEHVISIVADCVNRGGTVLLADLPDANVPDERERGYDRNQYSHLKFTEADFETAFPGCQFIRGRFPSYVNDALRFSVLIGPGKGGPSLEGQR